MFNRVFQFYEFNFDYTNEKTFLETLREEGLSAFEDKKKLRSAIVFTQQNKTEMINTANILLERYQLQLPKKAEKLISEFLNQQFEITSQNKKIFYHPSNETDDSLWATLLSLKNIKIFAQESKIEFVNPWEKQDIVVHGEGKKSAKEVVFSTKKIRMNHREGYTSAEFRRRIRI